MLGQNLINPTIEMVYQANDRITDNINLQSSIVNSEVLNLKYGMQIHIKTECLHPTGSFKIRGALNKVLALNKLTDHFITASAGNHAIGLAYSCRHIGVKATVVVPENTPQIKINTCEQLGATVIIAGANYDEAYLKAQELSNEFQYAYVHPVSDCDVVAGQGTIGLEIIHQLPHVEQVIVPIGGGGLISGIAIAIKSLKPEVKIIGVQAEGSKAYYESRYSGKLTRINSANTIAEGLSVKKPESYNYELIEKWIDEIIYVKEETIKIAVKEYLFLGKLLVEASGAVTLASIIENKIDKNKKTVIIASGSNIDEKNLLNLISEQ